MGAAPPRAAAARTGRTRWLNPARTIAGAAERPSCDLENAPVPFVILTAGRSGSSFLRHALASHPDAVCFGEILDPNAFEPDFQSGTRTIRRPASSERHVRYVSQALACLPPSQRAVGFKLKHFHFLGTRLAHFLDTSGTLVVHNTRRNVVAQSLSQSLAEAHDFVDWNDDPDAKGRYRKRIVVDIDTVIDRARYFQFASDRFRTRFAPSRVLELAYEDFCDADGGRQGAAEALARLLDFLRLDRADMRTPTARQRQSSYRDLVANLDDLLAIVHRRFPRWRSHAAEIAAT